MKVLVETAACHVDVAGVAGVCSRVIPVPEQAQQACNIFLPFLKQKPDRQVAPFIDRIDAIAIIGLKDDA